MDRDEMLKQWIHQYADRLTYLAYTYVRDHAIAQDVTQEAFIKAYKSMDQLRDSENPLPWLMRIVVNQCHYIARKKSWREVITSICPQKVTRSTEDMYIQKSRQKEVHTAILGLPETYRTPIVLFYFEELSIQQIAAILDINPGAVKTRLTRGRDRLHKLLKRGDNHELGEFDTRLETSVR